MNKKGAMSDILVWMILAFAISIIFVGFYYGMTRANDKLQDSKEMLQEVLGTQGDADEMLEQTTEKSMQAFENLKWITWVFIFFYAIGIIISSFLVRTNPVWFGAYILFWSMATVISFPLANAYETIYLTPELASTFSEFVGQNWIMLNLPYWVIAIGLIAGVILFINMVRSRNEAYGY